MEVKITTICRTDKINKKNEAPIALKVSKNYQTKKKSLGININIDYWDFENGVLKNNAPNKEYIQLVIDSTIQELNKKILNYQIQNQEFTLDDLLDNPKKKSKTITIKDYFNQITIQLKEANKLSSASKYKFCLSSLSKYHSMDIPFTDIDLKFLIDFEVFLRKEGLANNSIATKFSTLKAAYNSALKQKFFSCEESPFTNYQVGKLWTNTQKRAIQKEDIYRIKELDLSNICKYPSPYLEFSRDIFLFSYFTAGINFIDIATLKYHDIDNSHIYYSRHKTQKNMKATLLPDALVILKKYMKEEDFTAEAVKLKALCKNYSVPLIINDNLNVALRSGADGIHVGQEDMSAEEIRKLAGREFIIGVTAKTVKQAKMAEAAGADYIGVGAVFPSPTKQGAIRITRQELKDICEAVSIPSVAIGGVNIENMKQLKGMGMDGFAVVSALFAAEDIQSAARSLISEARAVVY